MGLFCNDDSAPRIMRLSSTDAAGLDKPMLLRWDDSKAYVLSSSIVCHMKTSHSSTEMST
eukprot:scaffold107562_cov17-Prasinocladus_malaysianus.AAC.1